jgi:hypothetical protein
LVKTHDEESKAEPFDGTKLLLESLQHLGVLDLRLNAKDGE